MYNQLLIFWGIGMSGYAVYTVLFKDKGGNTGRIRNKVNENLRKIKRYEKSFNNDGNNKGIM